ncbi:Lam4 protein [Saccharomycopsis crataegensis]|uniref:Lam4 protein n=1 Tax=Saccharomycopsis crataegensis TaxID=43959 RepID=A0AAV5QJ57_9ASCO|nr:Lam4 protein [Saccharomycopsis crataegensis]
MKPITLRKRSKSTSSNANDGNNETASKSPLANAPEIHPVRSKKSHLRPTELLSPHRHSRLFDSDEASNDNAEDEEVSLGLNDSTLDADSLAAPQSEDPDASSDSGKHDKGLLSGFLSIAQNVGNQLTSITSTTDAHKDEVIPAAIDSKKIESQEAIATTSHGSQLSENLSSIKDIKFKAVKADSPVNTLGNGNLSLNDFSRSPGHGNQQKHSPIALNIPIPGSIDANIAMPRVDAVDNDGNSSRVASGTNKFIQNLSVAVNVAGGLGSANLLDSQATLQEKLQKVEQQQKAGVKFSMSDRTIPNDAIMTPNRLDYSNANILSTAPTDASSLLSSAKNSPVNKRFSQGAIDFPLRSISPKRFSSLREVPKSNRSVDDIKRGKSFTFPKKSSYFEESLSNPNLSVAGGRSRSSSRTSSLGGNLSSKTSNNLVVPSTINGKRSELSFASERKQREFHSTFKRIPQTENLYVDYVCALSKDILLQGKMYVSENYISFNSNILGWVTNISVPLEEIVQIEKRTTAGFIPNALSIQTLHQRYFFTSFISRDNTFDFITMLWNHVVRGANFSSSGSINEDDSEEYSDSDETENDSSSSGYDSDSGLQDSDLDELSDMDDMTSSMDESEEEPKAVDTNDNNAVVTTNNNNANESSGLPLKLSRIRGKSFSRKEDKKSKDKNISNTKVNDNNNGSNEETSNVKAPSSGGGGGDDDELGTLPILGATKHAPTTSPWVKKPNETEIQSVVFPAPPGTIFSLLFGENDNTFATSLIQKQKNIDIGEISPYSKNPESGLKERKYSYTKPLSAPVGPKQTRCNITETIEKLDVDNEGQIQVLQVTHSPDVPSGNSFLVNTRFYMTWAKNNGTLVQIITFIEWSGKSWIKGAIESGTISGQKESIEILVNSINEELASRMTSGKSRKKSKTKTKSRKPKPSSKVKTPISTPTKELAANEGIFSNIYGVIDSILDSIPIPLIPKDFKTPIVLFLLFLFLLPTIFRGLFGSRASYGDRDYISTYSTADGEFTVIPPMQRLYSNGNLRNELQVNVWDWIEAKVNKEELSNEIEDSKDDESIGFAWREKYYDNSLSDSQKEYLSKVVKNRKSQELSKKYSKQELAEYVRLNEMRIDELKKMLSDMKS